MNNGIEAVTTAMLAAALDAASLRHQATASNIANAGIPGYIPQKVNFEENMAAASRALDGQGGADMSAVKAVRPELMPVLGPDGLPLAVQLDMEVADLSRNAVQYQALIKGLSRHMSILAVAVGDRRK